MPNARVGFLLSAALGHPRKWSLRRIIEAMLYLLCGGCRGGCYHQISRRLDGLLVSSMRDKGLRFSLGHEFRWYRALAIG